MNLLTLEYLAKIVDGHVIGDCSIHCADARPLQEASTGQITLLDDPKRISDVEAAGVAAVVVAAAIPNCTIPQLVSKLPHAAFAKIVEQFRPCVVRDFSGISPAAQINETAQIGAGCAIHPGVHIGKGAIIGDGTTLMPGVIVMPNCKIGANCLLFPGVVLYEYTVLESDVTIHAGSILGAYGFGYRQQEGQHVRTAQLGYVHVEANVEIGAGATIDRGTYGTTRIGTGTKVDNQVMIAHNCQIGKHNLICSQVGIAGSCRTGDYVVLAGQVGLKDHVVLGDAAIVGAQAGVMENLDGNKVYLGSPATSQREQMRIMAVERKLPDMRRALQRLTKEVAALTSQIEANGEPVAAGQTSDAAENKAA